MESLRAGQYRNQLHGEMAYKAFHPAPLPPDPPIVVDTEMLFLLGKANRLLGQLSGAIKQIPDIDLFVAMYVRKEALLSSQIEGTQATLDDILDPDIDSNTNQDIGEVLNYIKAMQLAQERLNDLPLCNRLLKEMHLVLMEGLRGEEQSPGEFRRSQNWIGPAGGSLKEAVFIPPPKDVMEIAMSDLERFMHEDDGLDPLLKIGLIHYQFETIHPFLDGNGRLGRMLISLWMTLQDLLPEPILYISYYLKRNRAEYYDRLMDVRNKGHFEQWLMFFLRAIIASAEDAYESVVAIHQIRQDSLAIIEGTQGRKKTLSRLLRYLEKNPIVEIPRTAKDLDLSYNTVADAINQLVELEILRQTNTNKRNRRYAYSSYLAVLRKETI